MSSILLCEGHCNHGNIQRIDVQIHRLEKTGRCTVTDESLYAGCVYTLHEPAARSGRYRCTVCQTERRCGA
jgi:hypothetical protein